MGYLHFQHKIKNTLCLHESDECDDMSNLFKRCFGFVSEKQLGFIPLQLLVVVVVAIALNTSQHRHARTRTHSHVRTHSRTHTLISPISASTDDSVLSTASLSFRVQVLNQLVCCDEPVRVQSIEDAGHEPHLAGGR